MCGFSGWVLNTKLDASIMVESLRSIKHRGPNDTLLLTEPNALNHSTFSCELSSPYSKKKNLLIDKNLTQTCFGFNRLSIVDLSNNAMQPFVDSQQQEVFMMNGEIYNYLELRTKHLRDVQFQSDSDSEVAFKLYQKFGNSFVDLLQGMFSIVIYNFKTKKLKAWRDRFGIKPLYYSITKEGLFFSSEMKGLFAMGLKKELNYTGLAYSMYLGTCPSPLTIYNNIESLQAGHFLEFDAQQQLTITPYWHLQYTESDEIIDSNMFLADMRQVCKLYASGQVPKAIMLSGGLDSGFLAYVYGTLNEKIEGVHIHTNEPEPDSEFEYAQLNAKNAGIPITNFFISKVFTSEEVEFFINSEEEPNTGPEPALFLCDKLKGKDIKVLYNALGPDEIFGGYAYFQKAQLLSNYAKVLPYLPISILPAPKKNKIAEIKQFGIETTGMVLRQLFSWREITHLLKAKNQPIPEHPIQYIKNQVAQLYPAFSAIPLLKKVSYYDLHYYISSYHAFRSDQPSMRYGLEMRFPFLEHTFVEKYFNQSTTFYNLRNETKPAFKEYIKPFLPEAVLKMPKKGFMIPINTMMKTESKMNKHKQWYLMMLEKITNKNLID